MLITNPISTLESSGLSPEIAAQKLDMLVDVIRKTVVAILEKKEFVRIPIFQKEKSKKLKLDHISPQEKYKNIIFKEQLHKAVHISELGIVNDKIPLAIAHIEKKYSKSSKEDLLQAYSSGELMSDIKVLMGIMYFMSTYGSTKSMKDRIKKATNDPQSQTYQKSDSNRALKAILVCAKELFPKKKY